MTYLDAMDDYPHLIKLSNLELLKIGVNIKDKQYSEDMELLDAILAILKFREDKNGELI